MVEVDSYRYVPILKWRQGEKTALKHLGNTEKEATLPLIELVNDEGDDPNDLAIDISTHWKSRPIYLDVAYRPPAFAFNALDVVARGKDLDIIPVVRLDTSAVLINRIKEVIMMHRNGFAIRLVVSKDLEYDFKQRVDVMLNQVTGSNPDKGSIDLIIDFGYIVTTRGCSALLKKITKQIPMKKWRRVVVASGAFPDSLLEFKPDEDNFLPRLELELWNSSRTLSGCATVFADYTVRYPAGVMKTKIRSSKSIRYTLGNQYQIFRGTKSDKPFKFLAHATNIRSLYGSEYDSSYSWGDEAIEGKATQFTDCLNAGINPEEYDDFQPGNDGEWVAISVNHHICVVLKDNTKL